MFTITSRNSIIKIDDFGLVLNVFIVIFVMELQQ